MGYQNFFATKLFTDIGASDTAITLETVPTVTSGRMVLEARNPTQREIIKYTGVSGNQITGVVRGQGGTTAKPHLKNSLVEMNVTAEDLEEALGLSFAFPTGIVMPYAGGSAPSGWLLAQGQTVSRTTYATLFAVIGTSFNTGGEAATDFRLPNMKGRVPVGIDSADTDFNTLGKSGGEKKHQLTVAEMPSHKHGIQRSPNSANNFTATNYSTYPSATSNGETDPSGGDQPHNNLQPYVSLNYIIKV